MYLFEKDGDKNKINVFSFDLDEKRATEYKKEKMAEIENDKKFLKATSNGTYSSSLLNGNGRELSFTKYLNQGRIGSKIKHRLYFDPNYQDSDRVLEKYYEEHDFNGTVYRILDNMDVRAILVPKDTYYVQREFRNLYDMTGIINLPLALYYFDQRSSLFGDDIPAQFRDEIIKLYNFAGPIDNIGYDALQKAEDYRIFGYNAHCIENTLECDKNKLTLIRKTTSK